MVLHGWLESIRPVGNSLVFGVLRDGKGRMQLLLMRDKSKEEDVKYDTLKNLPKETVVCIEGVVQERPKNDINPAYSNGHLEVSGEESRQDLIIYNCIRLFNIYFWESLFRFGNSFCARLWR